MAKQILNVLIVSMVFLVQASALTDPFDVIALENLFVSFNNTQQLKGWRLGGDPCQELWTGVSCAGPSVIYLKLHGLNLKGSLGTELRNLHSLKHLDLSSNGIEGEIPRGLPHNATHINLSCNRLIKRLPYSISGLTALKYLNLSHNLLSGLMRDVFISRNNIKEMDLSYNGFTGELPPSFEKLKSLSRLFLQNNQFTGSVVYLSELPLTELNIQSNHFSGVIPAQFQSIPNLWIDGNNFTSPPASEPTDRSSNTSTGYLE